MSRNFLSSFIILIFFACCSCKTLHVLHIMQTKDVEVAELSNKEKVVEFIPMHHVGKSEFYDGVKEIVSHYKAEGFVVYYEGVQLITAMDSALQDSYDRKLRRMIGVSLDTNGYAHYFHDKGLFRGLVDQPRYHKLGVDSNDINVDIEKYKLVDAYEEKFGKIELTDVDKRLRLIEGYPRSYKLPKEKVMSIILNYRNQNLANYIQASADKKIIVIYGEEHLKGTYGLLKELDPSWKRK
jgi:hypothetical protein